ncbi:hypothetical protein LTR97_000133 [Elasticomyces elasticus]|uniref:RTA1-domain-containing protein n=1 Tax=Elasticomyces elasticus TaxID=574655 RepID=A0AAN7WQZ9_9PEZI|nr:hypothetical protein LTR97_000133 [Elasticomyces elasticus]
MPELETFHDEYLWHYVPSLALSITFAVLFALATAVHGLKIFTSKLWFCLPFFFGGICEVIGYGTRAVAYNNTGELAPYLIQAIFLVLPPVFFAATLYMVYSRVVRSVRGEQFSLFSPRRTTWLFVIGDVLCLNVQSTGSSLLSNKKTTNIGNWVIIIGLGLQVVLFAIFIVCCLRFNMRFRAHLVVTGTPSNVPWQSCLNMLYATSLAILVRNVFRVAEFASDKDRGYLNVNEWPAYVFDGALMLLVMISFFAAHPSKLRLDARDSAMELLSEAGSSTGLQQTTQKAPSSGWSWRR